MIIRKYVLGKLIIHRIVKILNF